MISPISWIMRCLACLVMGAVLSAAPLRAAPVGDLSAALAMPRAGGLTGAADTSRFAWVVSEAGIETIWIGGPEEAARPVWSGKRDDGVELSQLALSRDGQRLAFVRGGDEEWAESARPNAAALAEPPEQEVLLIDLPGGQPQVLGQGHSPLFAPDGTVIFTQRGAISQWNGGSARRIAQIAGTARDMRLSPDGRRLLFVDDRDERAFAAVLDLGGDRVRYLAPGLSFAADPVFSPDGRKVAVIRYREPPPAGEDKARASYWTLDVVDAATGEFRTLWRAPPGKGGRYAGTRQHNLYWTADGRILFPWERDGWLHVYALAADGQGAPTDLTPGPFEVETFLLDADRRTLLFVANAEQTDSHQLWRAAPGHRPVRVTKSNSIESYPAVAGNAQAFVATSAGRPAHVVLADGKPLGPSAALEGAVAPRAVTYTAPDGITVHAQLFEGKGSGPRPGLLFIHGGPRRQMMIGFHPGAYYSNAYIMNQYLASRGFTVLAVNYRSGTGYGLAFRDAEGTGREGASEYRDVLAGAQWLGRQPGVDPARIGIWGGSWGGYLAALGLARDSDTFAAGVDFHGVHSMLRDPSDSLSPAEQAAARQLQWDSSPLGAIDSWRSPALLIHGDDDRNVGFQQSLLLARELAARGVPFEELVFPNERHGFLRHANWLRAYTATAEFLERHLKARP